MTRAGAPDAVVVGGGVAGLVAAIELARRGARVALHEASDRLGGAIAAWSAPDGRGGVVPVDLGAESFATRGGTVAALLGELGIADRVVAPLDEPAWLVGPGVGARGAAPLPATGVLGIPQSPFAGDVVRIVGVRGAARAALDLLAPFPRIDPDATLDALVRRRLGRRVAERIVAPVTEGVYSRPPSRLLVRDVLPELLADDMRGRSLAAAVRGIRARRPAGAAVAGLDGGMAVLVDALAERARELGVSVHLGSPVDLARPDPGLRDVGVVVDATPGEPAGSTTIVALVLDLPPLDGAPRGPGVLVARGDPPAPGVPRALTHSSAKWVWLADRLAPGRHVVRLSYDGRLAGSDATARRSLADASSLLGVPAHSGTLAAWRVQHWSHPAAPTQPARPTDPTDPTDPAEPAPPPRILRVGAAVAGVGLARVVAHAREAVAARLG